MGMLREFREFAMRGNVIDMAVGVIIGAAFGKIVTSLVSDILMPPIGKLVGNMNFNNLFYALDLTTLTTLDEVKKQGVAVIGYGAFLTTIIDFLIISLCIFAVVKMMNTLAKLQKQAPADPTTKPCPRCFSTINIQATRCPQCTSELS